MYFCIIFYTLLEFAKTFTTYCCTRHDVQTAIKKLKALGNGISVISLGKDRFLVQSVPSELTMDHATVIQLAEVRQASKLYLISLEVSLKLECCQTTCYTTESQIMQQLKWEKVRIHRALVSNERCGDELFWVSLHCRGCFRTISSVKEWCGSTTKQSQKSNTGSLVSSPTPWTV